MTRLREPWRASVLRRLDGRYVARISRLLCGTSYAAPAQYAFRLCAHEHRTYQQARRCAEGLIESEVAGE